MTQQEFQQIAFAYLGTRYQWGGSTPQGWDCSGFIQELLQVLGIDPAGDQNAQALHNHFLNNGKVVQDASFIGTLAFYGKSAHEINHVAMVIAKDRIIEAGGGDSKTLSLAMAVTQNAFVRVRHFQRRSDLVRLIVPKNLLFSP